MYKVIDENLRSYASVENLNKAVAKFGLEGCHPIIVGVPGTDRVTPLFQLDWMNDPTSRSSHHLIKQSHQLYS